MLVEVVLQLLISDVDAELLKRVVLEVLKPENVQQTDRQRLATVIQSKSSDVSDRQAKWSAASPNQCFH